MTQRRGWRSPPPAAFDLKTYRAPAGYVRVSTDEQAEEGTSIGSQIRQIQHYARTFGVELPPDRIYVDDGWSGRDLNRPAMARLRADVKAGRVDCVLVAKLDRLSRNLRDTVNLCLGEWQDEAAEGRRAVLKSISEPFDTFTDFGRMVFGLLAMFAEFERRRIAERTWSGKAARAEEGRNAGHRAPYGYRLVPAPDGRGSLFALVPEEAEAIRQICRLYQCGAGDRQIALRLNEEGRRFRGGRLWQAQQVARVLTNPMIAGIYAYGRTAGSGGTRPQRVPEEQWLCAGPEGGPPAIISPDAFRHIQALRAERRRQHHTGRGTALLTGLLRCGRCGAACGVKHAGPQGRYRYYRCLKAKQTGPAACSAPQVRADELEAQVVAAVTALLEAEPERLRLRLQEAGRRRCAGVRRALQEGEERLAELEALRRSYFTWLEAGRLTPEAVQQRLDELTREAAALKERTAQLNRTLTGLTENLQGPAGLGLSLPPGEGAWAALSHQERRQLLGLLISRLEVDGRRLRIHWRAAPKKIEFLPPEGQELARGASDQTSP